MEKENIIRTILKNEITWVVLIGGFIATFFSQVVIPINNIQIQLVQIQQNQQDIKKVTDGFDVRITANANDLILLKEQIRRIN